MEAEYGRQRGGKTKTPKWALSRFKRFRSDADRLGKMIDLSARGIAVLRGMPEILEVLAEGDTEEEHELSEDEIATAKAEAKMAQTEVDGDFPLLHGWATISLWSSLEELIKAFLADWLSNLPEAWEVSAVQKLKIRIGEYENIPAQERPLFLVAMVEREVGTGYRSGVAKFEELLGPFGLSGDVPDHVRKALFEMAHVRNLLVHRSGRVDREFANSCGWLNVETGEPLRVSRKMWRAYLDASHIYMACLLCRVKRSWGDDMSDFEASILRWDSELRSNYPMQPTRTGRAAD